MAHAFRQHGVSQTLRQAVPQSLRREAHALWKMHGDVEGGPTPRALHEVRGHASHHVLHHVWRGRAVQTALVEALGQERGRGALPLVPPDPWHPGRAVTRDRLHAGARHRQHALRPHVGGRHDATFPGPWRGLTVAHLPLFL